MALWTASVSIADEIEGRTALTLLSKPIGRRQFILGKFLGILVPVAILFIVLGTVFLGHRVLQGGVRRPRERPAGADSQTACEEMVQITPGLALAFLETVVLTSISVAISTRLPMLANLMICASIYVLGHLVPLLVKSSVGQFPIVPFIAAVLCDGAAGARPLRHGGGHFERTDGAGWLHAVGHTLRPALLGRGHAAGATALRRPRSGIVAFRSWAVNLRRVGTARHNICAIAATD